MINSGIQIIESPGEEDPKDRSYISLTNLSRATHSSYGGRYGISMNADFLSKFCTHGIQPFMFPYFFYIKMRPSSDRYFREIESVHNVDVLCEVKSRNSAGVNILEIVPEGTQVEKGDFLVRLDDSALQKDLLTQRIDVHQAKATLVQAEADVTAARLAMDEYLSGSYRQDLEQLEGAVFVARENLRRAEEWR